MGKVANGRLGIVVALAASALGLAPAACDHPPRPNQGGVLLTVTLPEDVKVKELTYDVSGNGIKPFTGRWETAQPQQQYEKLINHIPVGNDYQVVVTAKSADGRFMCQRTVKASVRRDTITRLVVALACVDGGDGTIVISVGIACTTVRLATLTVSPLAASVGGTMALTATPLEADAGALEYAWSAPSGAFGDTAASETTYRCDKAGHVKLNLLVIADICQESHTTEVDCLAPTDAGPKDAGADSAPH